MRQLPVCKSCNDNDEPRALLCRACSTPEEIHAHRQRWLQLVNIGGGAELAPIDEQFCTNRIKIQLAQFVAADSQIYCFITVTAQANPSEFRWTIWAKDHSGEPLYLIARSNALNGNTLDEIRQVIAAIERSPKHDLSNGGRWTARRAVMQLDYSNGKNLADQIRAMPESATVREVLKSIRPAQWRAAPKALRRALIQETAKVQQKRNKLHRMKSLISKIKKEVSQ